MRYLFGVMLALMLCMCNQPAKSRVLNVAGSSGGGLSASSMPFPTNGRGFVVGPGAVIVGPGGNYWGQGPWRGNPWARSWGWGGNFGVWPGWGYTWGPPQYGYDPGVQYAPGESWCPCL